MTEEGLAYTLGAVLFLLYGWLLFEVITATEDPEDDDPPG